MNAWRLRTTLFAFPHYKVQTNKGQPFHTHKHYSQNYRLKSVSINKVFVPLLTSIQESGAYVEYRNLDNCG